MSKKIVEVASVFVCYKNHYLFLQRSLSNHSWPGWFCTPGGKKETRDKDLYDTGLRELTEETDIRKTQIFDYMRIGTKRFQHDKTYDYHYFITRLRKFPTIKLMPSEMGYVWINLNDALGSPSITPATYHGIQLAIKHTTEKYS